VLWCAFLGNVFPAHTTFEGASIPAQRLLTDELWLRDAEGSSESVLASIGGDELSCRRSSSDPALAKDTPFSKSPPRLRFLWTSTTECFLLIYPSLKREALKQHDLRGRQIDEQVGD